MEIDDSIGDDYEEEELLVYVKIDSTSLSVDQIREAQNLRIFGIDAKKPLLQINNHFFQGKY